jgi:CheY-like chemotaxis protein
MTMTTSSCYAVPSRKPEFSTPWWRFGMATRRLPIYSDREKYPWPVLLLLDLKMPGLDGFDVLVWWRKQAPAEPLPIVVFSSSNRDSDIQKAMELGADAYCSKPAGFDYLLRVAHELRDRWLSLP